MPTITRKAGHGTNAAETNDGARNSKYFSNLFFAIFVNFGSSRSSYSRIEFRNENIRIRTVVM
jgi:hypothetical protein